MINRIVRKFRALFTTPAPRVIVETPVLLEPMQSDIVYNYVEEPALTAAELVISAREEGLSYRQIMARTGLSYRQVRKHCLAD